MDGNPILKPTTLTLVDDMSQYLTALLRLLKGTIRMRLNTYSIHTLAQSMLTGQCCSASSRGNMGLALFESPEAAWLASLTTEVAMRTILRALAVLLPTTLLAPQANADAIVLPTVVLDGAQAGT